MEDPLGFIELLRSSPQAMLVFAGMAAAIAWLFYLLLKRDIRHIEKLLTNHITETNGKIEDLKGEVKANEARAEAWRKEQKTEARANEARAEAWRKEQTANAKENIARLEKKLDKILEKNI